MDNDADMVILLRSYENESFTLMEFGQIIIRLKSKDTNSGFHSL